MRRSARATHPRVSSSRGRSSEATAGAHRPLPGHEARIYANLHVDGVPYWTLFDSGARRTCVTSRVASRLPGKRFPAPLHCALGGRTHTVNRGCLLMGDVEGHAIAADAMVVDRLFKDDRRRVVDVLLGIETMETWGIGLDIARKRPDFRFYSREVVEG